LGVEPATLRDLAERRGRDDRDRPFCFFEDSVVTFGALDAHSNRLANSLSGLGIGPATVWR
jgi:acyl-CoA synthetase (AMP-forming)/AMP-acid ligase II